MKGEIGKIRIRTRKNKGKGEIKNNYKKGKIETTKNGGIRMKKMRNKENKNKNKEK